MAQDNEGRFGIFLPDPMVDPVYIPGDPAEAIHVPGMPQEAPPAQVIDLRVRRLTMTPLVCRPDLNPRGA
jgi:hypothetical protein